MRRPPKIQRVPAGTIEAHEIALIGPPEDPWQEVTGFFRCRHGGFVDLFWEDPCGNEQSLSLPLNEPVPIAFRPKIPVLFDWDQDNHLWTLSIPGRGEAVYTFKDQAERSFEDWTGSPPEFPPPIMGYLRPGYLGSKFLPPSK
jgi:hypothetical protein